VIDDLKSKFLSAIRAETICCGQTTLEIDKEQIIAVLRFLKQTPNPGFEILMDLTGVDFLAPVAGTKILYFLHNPTTLERIQLATFVPRQSTLPSVTDLWAGADWYERELYDLFGVQIQGHPDMKRILMPDDWKGHPLRRDYSLTEEPVEFKHDRKPKTPSEIIPYATDIPPGT
jgi:NADH-quinone oxidoreductase subunit C